MCESFGAEENLLCFGEVRELEKHFLELFRTAAVLFATLKISLLIVCTTLFVIVCNFMLDVVLHLSKFLDLNLLLRL